MASLGKHAVKYEKALALAASSEAVSPATSNVFMYGTKAA